MRQQKETSRIQFPGRGIQIQLMADLQKRYISGMTEEYIQAVGRCFGESDYRCKVQDSVVNAVWQ